MNNLYGIFVFISIFLHVNCILFDVYSGKKVNEELKKELRSRKAFDRCTIDIKSCTPQEGSRVSGTCNNYKHPLAGGAGRPYLRFLKPDYANSEDIRRASNNKPLPSARVVRTTLEKVGYFMNASSFNAAAVHFIEFIQKDVSAMNGPIDFIYKRQHCCTSKGSKDPKCIPIMVHQMDPHLKGTNIRCLNFSRAETFQDLGCSSDLIPEQINYQTPMLDLSIIYGVEDKPKYSVRSYKNGLLKLKMRDNRYVPITSNDCFRGEGDENLCYKIGLPKITTMDIRTMTFAIFFMREHNRLAKALHELNPCWKDDRLFKVARQINIATAANIFMYELLPNILGYSNMVNYGVLSDIVESVKQYNEESQPGLYAEFAIGLRFFRTFLGDNIKLYNDRYEEVQQIGIEESFNLQNLLEIDTIFDEINRGTFYQSAGRWMDTGLNQITSNFTSRVKPQEVYDQISMDIQRGRDMGIRGYNDYRNLCGLRHAKSFTDLLDVIDVEKVKALRRLYQHVDDIDFLVGVMSESNIENTFVGPTLFCIIVKQLQIFRYSDRFWFESDVNNHKFSISQLREIRKTNMARFACDNVNAIKFIQPHALLKTQLWNSPVPCANVHGLDITKWRDSACRKKKQQKKKRRNARNYY